MVAIALVALAMPTLPPATLLPTPMPMLSPLPSHLSACNKESNGKGSNSNGKRDKEGDGDGGKSNVNSNKESKGKGSKRDEYSNKEGHCNTAAKMTQF